MRARLVTLLTAAVLGTIAAAGRAADPAATALADLERAGEVSRSPLTGLATFLRLPTGGTAPLARSAAGAEERARAFLDQYGGAFGVGGRVAVDATRVNGPDAVGMEHVRLQQMVDGVPVAGGELSVHLRAGGVAAVLARTLPDLDAVSTTPAVTAAQAEAAAAELAAGWPEAVGATFSTPRLELFNRALLTGRGRSRTRLAWFVEALADARQEYIWIDAQDGTVLHHFNQLPSALVRQVFDAANASQFGVLARNEGDPPTGNVQVDNAYDFAGDTWNYYATQHGRDSYDDAGGTLVNVVRSCPTGLCFGLCPCPNAFNATFISFFGDNWVTDDIVAHEWTHGVTAYAAGLVYSDQPGALNESYSDIFGETVDLTNGAGTDTPAVRWRVAEDLNGTGIRDMYTPNNFGDPGKVSDPQVSCASFDNGGVHTNSGIPNHAYALMVDGGTYNGFTVTGIGLTKAAKIEYRALNDYLIMTATMADNAAALTQSCTDLIGTAGITAADCVEVGKALDAVEMDGPWPCNPCGVAPRLSCRSAGTSKVLWQQNGGADDKLLWKWTRGQSTTVPDFADPQSSADYALCVYRGGSLLSELDVPAHATRWKPTAPGFRYRDTSGAASGITKIVLKSSSIDAAKVIVKGAGATLPDPTLGGLATPIVVQLVNLDTSVCWEGTFDGADVTANAPGVLKAKAKN